MNTIDSKQQIAFALARIGVFLRSCAWEQAEVADPGLTPTQAQILAHLATRGPSKAGVLASELGVTPPTVSDAVAALVRKGHVVRRPDPLDGRAAYLHLTADGAPLAEVVKAPPSALVSALDTLPEAELGALQRALIGVIRALQEAGAIPAQRMCVTCRHFRPFVHDDPDRPHMCEFVNAAFGDANLRLDCGEHEPAPAAEAAARWRRFKAA